MISLVRLDFRRDAPLLAEGEILNLARAGELPPCFRTRLTSPMLRPMIPVGSVLTVEQEPPFKGAITCLPWKNRLVWRRVLGVDEERVLLRAEMAPFADGWFSEILGCVKLGGPLPHLAKCLPKIWTRCGWEGYWIQAHVRNVVRRRKRNPLKSVPFHVAPLAPDDKESLRALCSSVYGEKGEEKARSLKEGVLALGLWTGENRLVGSTFVSRHIHEGYSFNTMVDPRFNGLGGATALLRSAVSEARRLGLRRVYAYVGGQNFGSRRAYRRAGFRFRGKWWRDYSDPFLGSERQLMEVEVSLR